jgi:hypothetical protein
MNELELDRAFSDRLASSKAFCEWVLQQTKFRDVAQDAILLNHEQATAKPKKKPENWWRHWWCRLEDGSESETDIFAVFELPDTRKRIALHIEDKPPHGKFTPNQYANYNRRAEFMANKPQYMNYSDYTTVLLAPNAFFEANNDKLHYFDSLISYESVAGYITEFACSLREV